MTPTSEGVVNTTAIATKETEVNCQNVTISEYQVTLYPEQEGVRQMHMKSISRISTKHLQNIIADVRAHIAYREPGGYRARVLFRATHPGRGVDHVPLAPSVRVHHAAGGTAVRGHPAVRDRGANLDMNEGSCPKESLGRHR